MNVKDLVILFFVTINLQSKHLLFKEKGKSSYQELIEQANNGNEDALNQLLESWKNSQNWKDKGEALQFQFIGKYLESKGYSKAIIINKLKKIKDDESEKEIKLNGELKKQQKPFYDLILKSKLFEQRIKFPTNNNRISVIAGDNIDLQNAISEQARNTYPIYDQKILILIKDFLQYKRKHGSSIEKTLYENMHIKDFIRRLLINRPLMFMTEQDYYLLKDGKTRGYGGFENIGTENEQAPLILKNYLSYDEMQIAALIGVSVPTYFINNGSRDNEGKKGEPNTYEEKGIYIGLVGARFEKPNFMEWQHIIVTPEQNTIENGYGKINEENSKLAMWSKFYGIEFPTFEEAKEDNSGRFKPFEFGKKLFDSIAYKKRMEMVIEPFLIDAQKRAVEQGKKAYVHVVGLGLGVWQKLPIQTNLMLEVYADIIKKQNLSEISDINFSWFKANNIEGIKNGEYFKANGNNIKIHFSERNPSDKLKGEDSDKLLVAQYAWDGNAYPGNEYWDNALSASGDPAAACCSTIPELQNPEINTHMLNF